MENKKLRTWFFQEQPRKVVKKPVQTLAQAIDIVKAWLKDNPTLQCGLETKTNAGDDKDDDNWEEFKRGGETIRDVVVGELESEENK